MEDASTTGVFVGHLRVGDECTLLAIENVCGED
jgi:hypothetical protein